MFPIKPSPFIKIVKTKILTLFLLPVFISCGVSKKNVYDPAKKYSAIALKEDFLLLKKILESNHPSLYWYATKNTIDSVFSSTYTSITDSLTEQQFRNKIARAISEIRCGHTAVRSSKSAYRFYGKKVNPQFPLSLKVWRDSAVVIVNNLRRDSVKRGTIITSINGVSTAKIIDSITSFISTDGFSNNFKYQVVSFNFPAYYRNIFGVDSQYVIKYLDTVGIERQHVLKNFDPKLDSLNSIELPFTPLTKKQLRKLRITAERGLSFDSTLNTAILSVNTFSKGRLPHFFHRSFKKIKKEGVKNLVIDLRLNTGGSVLASTRFCQYLIDKPFNVADTVAAISRSFNYKRNIKPWFIYWLNMHITGRRAEDGRIHFRYFERHRFKPKQKHHFDGNIYVLTGGYTFSAATLVAAQLKGQDNVTIVGEETGGGYYGNTAMHITNIILPNTKVSVSLPLFRIVLDKDRLKTGRGVLPDVESGPSSAIIKAGIDGKMDKVKEIISKEY